MGKRDFKQGMDALLYGSETSNVSNKEKEESIEHVKATYYFDSAQLEKIKAIAYFDRKPIGKVISDALELFIIQYKKLDEAIEIYEN